MLHNINSTKDDPEAGRYLLVVYDPGNETDQASYKHKGVLPRARR